MRIGRFFMALVSLAATSLHAQVDERTEYVPVLRLVELADGSRVFIDVIGRIVGTIPGGAEMESEGFFTAPPQLLGWPLLVGRVRNCEIMPPSTTWLPSWKELSAVVVAVAQAPSRSPLLASG